MQPGTVRMTLSGETTRKEIDRAVEALKQNLRKLRDEKIVFSGEKICENITKTETYLCRK